MKFFVLDDQAYHYMQMLQKPAYLRTTATILARLDYKALAQAFGVAYPEIVSHAGTGREGPRRGVPHRPGAGAGGHRLRQAEDPLDRGGARPLHEGTDARRRRPGSWPASARERFAARRKTIDEIKGAKGASFCTHGIAHLLVRKLTSRVAKSGNGTRPRGNPCTRSLANRRPIEDEFAGASGRSGANDASNRALSG